MAAPTEKADYISFLVRMWREPTTAGDASRQEADWIIQIERIPSGEMEYFASLEQFFAFVREGLSGPSPRGRERV